MFSPSRSLMYTYHMVHRNSLLSGLFFLILAAAAGFLWLLFLQTVQGTLFHSVTYGADHRFWMVYGEAGETPVHLHFLMSGLLLVLGTASGILTRRHFHRTSSTEAFFVAAFFFVLTLDFLRLLVPYLQQRELSYVFGLGVSRLVYGLRMLELFALLGAGLYALGFEYQKANNILLGAFVLALAAAFSWPLDSQHLLSTLLYPLSDEPAAAFTHGTVAFLTVGAMALASGPGGDLKRWGDAGIFFLLIVGRELTYYPQTFFPGLILLAAGGMIYLQVKKKSRG